jgi:hypothetical protein
MLDEMELTEARSNLEDLILEIEFTSLKENSYASDDEGD